MTSYLHKFYWFWIPVVAMGIQILLEIFIDGNTLSLMHSENGPHEIMQAIIAASGFLVALYALFSKKVKGALLKGWFLLAALGCFYVTGEELSWGQHVLDWSTPDFWAEVNDQKETNLHNTSSWLDQKPRLILIVGIVFGSLIYPFLKIKNILKLPSNLDFLFPEKELKTLAFFVIVPQLLEKIFEAFNIFIFARYSEVQEIYVFYFVLLYLIIIFKKSIQLQKS